MTIELKIPAVGESITDVEIGEWLKTEGAAIAKDEPVVVIETEKATLELPAPAAGRLIKVLKKTGETAKVGETIGLMEAGKNESAAASEPPSGHGVCQSSGDFAADQSGGGPPHSKTLSPPRDVNEPARSTAVTAAGSGTVSVRGAGTGGERPPEPAGEGRLRHDTPAREEQVIRMSLLRRTIAKRLVEAQHTAALLTTFNEVDMSSILALRQQYQETFQKKYGVKLGFMSFFVKAVIDALKQIPALNAEIRDTDIVYRNYHDIGVAVSTDRGLVVPVMREADRLSFAEIEQTIGDFARRARDGKLKPEELEGGTFTITNGGVFGSLLSTPLVNAPQSGILGMHAIQERPIALAGQVVIRPMMYVALTYDHRLVDGREAVLFLRRIKDAVESPARMLLEI